MLRIDTLLTRDSIIVFVGLTLLFITGCSDNKPGGGFSMPPAPVEVAPVTLRNVADRFEGVGTIEAVEAITVVAEIDAIVKDIPFGEGQWIKQGELIAQLDNSQLAAEVARAEALRAQSEVSYKRIKAIVEQNAGAPQDLDNAAAELKVADANLAVAKARLAKTRVVAPFDGIIGSRQISKGVFLRAGQPIADLANIDAIRVNFSAPERFLSQLTRGAEVAVSTTAYPGVSLSGKIIVVNPVVDAATRSARVVARVANPGRRFRPGMSANVSAVLAERKNAMTIPTAAVFASGNESFVFVVKPDSTVARVALTLGTRLTDIVEVLQGLEQGMTVVSAGHQKLFEGAKVAPIPSQGTITDEKKSNMNG